MNNSSNVEVKDSCKLGGGKICNQGDINNLKISKLKEDIEPKEASNIELTINTIINNKRDVGFVPRLSVMQIKYLNNNGVGLIPIKNKYGIAYILYKNKEKALKLRDYANSKNGFLNDKTPEEARYVGKLLSYSDKSIDEYIKRKYKNLYLDTRTPDDFNDLDENLENEGVGDKYAEKRFGIDQEFSNFDKQYGAYKNSASEEIVYRDSRVTIIKNPKSLKHIGSNVRGVIDTDGNLYVEEEVAAIHEQLVRILSKLGLIKYDGDWGRDIPKYFITVQRYYETNYFYLGESNEVLVPDYDRYDDNGLPSADEAIPVFRQFLNKAKSKNPDIKFFDQMLNQYESINENGMINEGNIMSLQDLPFKDEIKKIGGNIYSVGGAVRDEFLGKESKDLDILITGIPMNELENILSKYGKVDAVGKSFGILKFKPRGSSEDIDVAIPRTERPTGEGGHKGFQVTSDHNLSIEDDLLRRDLTINAIAKSIDGKIIDPYHGIDDLKNKIIRVVNPEAFSDDPLRMLRAIQFSTRFGFEIEPNTMDMIIKNASRIKEIPSERILGELDKIVHKGNPLKGAELLIETNVYQYIFGINPNPTILNRPFNNVKTMGEFLFLLTYNIIQNPSEFYKSNLSGDINTYKEIKSYEIGYNTTDAAINMLRSVAHNMYITSNYSITSNIILGKLKNACNDFFSF
jgi:tRNA nucleotidyltransferase/poly(A) polymerase